MNSRSLRLVVRPARGILGSSRVSHRTRQISSTQWVRIYCQAQTERFSNLALAKFDRVRLWWSLFWLFSFFVRVFDQGAKIRVKNKIPLPAFRMDTHPKQDLDAQMVSFCDCLYFDSWKFDTGVTMNTTGTCYQWSFHVFAINLRHQRMDLQRLLYIFCYSEEKVFFFFFLSLFAVDLACGSYDINKWKRLFLYWFYQAIFMDNTLYLLEFR